MVVEISCNDFNKMITVYLSAGLPFSSSIKIDILKKLILIAGNNNEIYYLHDKIVALKGIYSQVNSSKIKQQISEVISLFQERKSFFDQNPVQTAEEIEKYINDYLVERRKRIRSREQEKRERQIEMFDRVNLPSFEFIEFKIKEREEGLKRKRIARSKPRKPQFSGDGSNDPEEVIQRFFSLSVREKRLCLDYLETMDISFEETMFLYEEYVFSREGKGNSARGQLILREYLLRMLISKARSFDEHLILCNLVNAFSKERKIITSNMINYIPVPESVEENYQGANFETLLYLYLKQYDKKELRSTLFERMDKGAFTLDQSIIVYTLMITASSFYKVAMARRISLLIKTPRDMERVEKIIPKWKILWGEITGKATKEVARS